MSTETKVLLGLAAVGLGLRALKMERERDRAIATAIRLIDTGNQWKAQSEKFQMLSQITLDRLAEAEAYCCADDPSRVVPPDSA